jgi:hypothetical protein
MAAEEKSTPFANPSDYLSDGVYRYSRRKDSFAVV